MRKNKGYIPGTSR